MPRLLVTGSHIGRPGAWTFMDAISFSRCVGVGASLGATSRSTFSFQWLKSEFTRRAETGGLAQ